MWIIAYLTDSAVPFLCGVFLYMCLIYLVYGISYLGKGIKKKKLWHIIIGVIFLTLFSLFLCTDMISVAADRIFYRK